MSAYKGQRGPNVSQYIANLNRLSPLQDSLADPAPTEDDFSAFLEADFFDVNSGLSASDDFTAPVNFGVDAESEANPQSKTSATLSNLVRNHATMNTSMDFHFNHDFQFADFGDFGPSAALDPSLQSLPQSQSNLFSLASTYTSSPPSTSPVASSFDSTNKRRKLDNIIPLTPQLLDENARVAAEEDKRRRNTAASARFRVKKKQREQALEKTAKDMSDKVNLMEVRIQQLETENAWLKSLITEKNGGISSVKELRALLTRTEKTKNDTSSPPPANSVIVKKQETKADV